MTSKITDEQLWNLPNRDITGLYYQTSFSLQNWLF